MMNVKRRCTKDDGSERGGPGSLDGQINEKIEMHGVENSEVTFLKVKLIVHNN